MDLGLDVPVAFAPSTPPANRAGCGKTAGFYRPRDPQRSAFYQLIQEQFPTFQAVYALRYQERYGYWRPIVSRVVEAFLRCGDLQQGFARVRCADCGHEVFVAFSCKQRCLCPSCHEKRALGTALHVSETVCAAVPHRQFVFTIPKRFRLYFRYERNLLGELARCAWETVLEVYQAAAGLAGVPGMMAGLQTFGGLIHWHPHVHALATEGVFDARGQFIPLPKLASEPFLKLWEQKVFHLLVKEKKITPEVGAEMENWKYSGFSVDQSVRLAAGDRAGMARLVQYILRCPFSQARLLQTTPEGQVLYKASRGDCHRFPEPGREDLSAGVKRNFQVFAPLDFLAEVTQHIPEPGEHLIRYYGYYSNKSRGLRAKVGPAAQKPGEPRPGPSGQEARRDDEDHRFHRRGGSDRKDSAPLRTVGRAAGARPASGSQRDAGRDQAHPRSAIRVRKFHRVGRGARVSGGRPESGLGHELGGRRAKLNERGGTAPSRRMEPKG